MEKSGKLPLVDFLMKARSSGLLVPVFLLLTVIMMIVPLPTFLLDILLTVNISLALLTLLTTIYVEKPLDFGVFPSLLLILTLFRLALNISTTRLILLQGKQFSGEVIRAFGNFVVGGNYVVGLVIFLILVVIQFVVITRGATRVSEVAARFTLDKIPVKMMSIDSDLQAGLIDQAEAKRRRLELNRESEFYGSMDGASKFVSGDAIAGVVITVINIIGGFVIGVFQHHMGFMESAQTFTLLTVGDGLVSQLPALLISTATGILVTRGISDEGLSEDIRNQMVKDPRGLKVAGGLLLLLGFIPGLPHVPFITISVIFILSSWLMEKELHKEEIKEAEDAHQEEAEKIRQPDSVADLVQVDDLELEIGYNLVSLFNLSQSGNLLDRITIVRRQIAMELGLMVPLIRIRDNMNLDPNTYVFKIKGVEVDRAQVMSDMYLAMNPGGVVGEIAGIKTVEPAYKMEAYWIEKSLISQAEAMGYTVIEPSSVIVTHISELLKRYAYEIMDRERLKKLLDNLQENYPTITEEFTGPKSKRLKDSLLRVLKNLLKEGVSIKNLPTILEAILDYQGLAEKGEIVALTAMVRVYLGRQIAYSLRDSNNEIHVLTFAPDLENQLIKGEKSQGYNLYINLDPTTMEKFQISLTNQVRKLMEMGLPVIILVTDLGLRMYLKEFLGQIGLREIIVIAYEEVANSGVTIKAEGMVKA
jgi:flagellar biosynthesis protein FlhA